MKSKTYNGEVRSSDKDFETLQLGAFATPGLPLAQGPEGLTAESEMSPNHGVGVGAWHRRRWPGVIAVQIGAPRRYDEKERSGARVWLAMLVAESGPAGDAERSAERLEFRIIFFGVADAKLMMS